MNSTAFWKNPLILGKTVLTATFLLSAAGSALAADAGKFVGGDLKVDGIVFPDTSVMRKLSDATGPWSYTPSGLDIYYLSGKIGIGTQTPAESLSIANNGSAIELGAGVAGKEYNAGKIAYQLFGTHDALDIVGAGPLNNRKIHFYSEGGATFDGGATFGGKIGVGTTSPSHVVHAIDVTPNTDAAAVYGEHASADFYGIGVQGKGGWKGVFGEAVGAGSSAYIGVNGSATSTNATGGATYGGFFSASGALNNYGIYASAAKNYFSGNIGLGTTTPGAKLHLKGSGYPSSFMHFDTTSAGQDSGIRFYEGGIVKSHFYWDAGNQAVRLLGATAYDGLNITLAGNVGIGTVAPADKLHVWGTFLRVEGAGGEQAYIGGDGAGGDVQIGSMNGAISNVAMYNPTSGKYMSVFLKDVYVNGGADLAEPFNSVDAGRLEPGMVMTIDSENPGQLLLANSAYDTRVAGIVSGANGIKAGMTMTQEGTLASGSVPVALSGRVYAWADASYGAIKPGDLLTTSDTPGHTMKVSDHSRAQGAIVGKAMSKLSEGTGLVLVLVTLQ